MHGDVPGAIDLGGVVGETLLVASDSVELRHPCGIRAHEVEGVLALGGHGAGHEPVECLSAAECPRLIRGGPVVGDARPAGDRDQIPAVRCAVATQHEEPGVLRPQGAQHVPVDLGGMGSEAVALGRVDHNRVDLIEGLTAQPGFLGQDAPGLGRDPGGALDTAAAVLGHGGGDGVRGARSQVDDEGPVVGDGRQQLAGVRRPVAGMHAYEDDAGILHPDLPHEERAQMRLALGALLLEPDGPVLGPQEALTGDLVAVQSHDGDGLALILVDIAPEQGVPLAGLVGLPRLQLLDGSRSAADGQPHVPRGDGAEALGARSGAERVRHEASRSMECQSGSADSASAQRRLRPSGRGW